MSALGALAAAKYVATTGEAIFTPSGLQGDFAVDSGDVVYRGGLVSADADGKLVPSADAANTYFCGVALSTVTGDDTLRCSVDVGGGFIILNYTPGSVAENMIGNEVFADGDQDCDLVGGVSNAVPIGVIRRAVSSTEVEVHLYSMAQARARQTTIAEIAA